ncbi:hypothetical protein FB192DRAFT_1130452 [Mucor lusitanicus]|uniref:Uncharacterized protein n=1 Tax=Mucor circinelloides f. lusitanicus TaxID=29924 RepID=A0A8H4BFJ9_MUCCL|nr:hypothetical protein FB192DRAFT_1130452 [Mucor lusitanicus]
MYDVWELITTKPPEVLNIAYDGQSVATVHLLHHIAPNILPSYCHLQLRGTTTIYFQPISPASNVLKVARQEDNWHLGGKCCM